MSAHSASEHHRSTPALALAALGVVYGDIGTSPLYALRECFHSAHHIDPTHDNVLGVLSLMLYSLILIITGMYVTLMLRADNRGEGGILALMVLTMSSLGEGRAGKKLWLVMVGLFGAALLVGDGMITPAITVLGAMEGLETIGGDWDIKAFILPFTLVVLFFLFRFQRHGSGRLGVIFGPVILLWFIVMGVLGLGGLIKTPEVLLALNPLYGINFLLENGSTGFRVLGSVFLVVTGGEALYADMGHFGARPIRLSWYCVVLPCLVLNYFGQGALLLHEPGFSDNPDYNPFYALAPSWGVLPLVILATFAAAIASQAVISGVFSVVRQAVLLGYLPRVRIVHTSADAMGQIYVPAANGLLMVCTMGLVLGFGTSSALAGAYGVAVTTTMLFTTVLLFVVASKRWNWPLWIAVPICGIFLLFNSGFTGAAYLKVPEGGWFPLMVGFAMYAVMMTWRQGRKRVRERLGTMTTLPLDIFAKNVTEGSHQATRVPGTAVYLYSAETGTPRALLHNLRYNKVLHEKVIVLTIRIDEHPHVKRAERLELEDMGKGVHRVFARYGFMESPDIAEIMTLCDEKGLHIERHTTMYVLARENIKMTNKPGLWRWQQALFSFLSRNAHEASGFFNIPVNQVVELGIQVEL